MMYVKLICGEPLNYGSPSFKRGIETAAAIGIGASVIGAWASSAAAERTNSTNREIAKEANSQNMKMLQEQERYNNPVNQRQMFEQAGYSPVAMLGNASSVGLGSAAQAAPSQSVLPFGSFDNMANMLFNYQNLSADTAEKKANVLKTNAETFNMDAQNRFVEQQQQFELLNKIQQFKSMGLDNIAKGLENQFASDSFQFRLQNLNLGNQLLQNQISKTIADTTQIEMNTMIAHKEFAWIDKIKSAELNLTLEKIGTEMAAQQNYGASARNQVAQALLAGAEKNKVDVDANTARRAADSIVKSYKEAATKAHWDALVSRNNSYNTYDPYLEGVAKGKIRKPVIFGRAAGDFLQQFNPLKGFK